MTNLRQYILVTLSYWGFTITDGALRTLVLLHFHDLDYTPFQVASLFLFYELFGVITNLVGGWIASRFGLKSTLVSGFAIQALALLMLSLLSPHWSKGFSLTYVIASQALSGIAKDLTKMSAKAGIKYFVPEGSQSKLFKWVAILTGSKNALKGVGFFVGGFLLTIVGFKNAIYLMAALLLVAMIVSMARITGDTGKIKSEVKFRHLFSMSREINFLSAARFFLFGSRDVWFVVALPVFLQSALGWTFTEVSSFLAVWIIGYGLVQSVAPSLFKNEFSRRYMGGKIAVVWAFLLALTPVAIVLCYPNQTLNPNIVLIIGLKVFGILFAINSSLHSYLILAYADIEKVALNVGFYYMANAGGRLIGTVLSGAVYQSYGLTGCLWISAAFILLSGLISKDLKHIDLKWSAKVITD